MLAQAFFYNASFFSYALILQRFYGVHPGRVGLYVIPFAVGNFLGQLLLGRLFDGWSRAGPSGVGVGLRVRVGPHGRRRDRRLALAEDAENRSLEALRCDP
jgi:MFS family permease